MVKSTKKSIQTVLIFFDWKIYALDCFTNVYQTYAEHRTVLVLSKLAFSKDKFVGFTDDCSFSVLRRDWPLRGDWSIKNEITVLLQNIWTNGETQIMFV